MRYTFDWVREKNGWQILVIEGRQQDAKIELLLTDEDALKLYKFIGENFNVESTYR